jgi:putative endonuclease
MNKRTKGNEKEKLAAAYLCARGIHILEQNFRVRQGEIDLIGSDGKNLLFFEVKYRKNPDCGTSAEAVGFRKQRQICKVAAFYRAFHHVPQEQPCRYDVIAIEGEQVRWYKNAFMHIESGWVSF